MSAATPPKRADITFVAIFRRTGIGKTTLAVALALLYALRSDATTVVSNVLFKNDGSWRSPNGKIKFVHLASMNKILEYVKAHPGCVVLLDEFDKAFSSRIGWLNRKREQKLTELTADARKHGAVAMIATSQGRRKINNIYRQNCKYVMEPTGTLDGAGCPQFLCWDDVELYEEGRSRYSQGSFELCDAAFPLAFLDRVFDTREVVPLEWD